MPAPRPPGVRRQGYAEFDFNNSNNNVLTNGVLSVVPNYTMRLRQAYAAFGPWLVGHATGNFTDNDSDIEVIDDGGQAGTTGRSRNGQVRYTWATPWPGLTVMAAAEQPASEFAGPNGTFASDSSPVAVSACPTANLLPVGSAALAAGNQLATACLANSAEFDAAQSREPAGVLAARIDQPWGHLRLAAVVKDAVLNDGRGIDKTWIGYGGAISGDVKPFPVWSPRDDIGFSASAGEGLGGYIPNMQAVATNFGGTLGGQNPTVVGGMGGGNSFNTLTGTGPAARSVRFEGPGPDDHRVWPQDRLSALVDGSMAVERRHRRVASGHSQSCPACPRPPGAPSTRSC